MRVLIRRVPRVMESGGVMLKKFGFGDSGALLRHLATGELEDVFPGGRSSFASRTALWRHLTGLYPVLYAIKPGGGNAAGVIGARCFGPDGTAELGLLIFDGKRRGLGYGGRAVRMLAGHLPFVREFRVNVRRENGRAVSFWEKTGFRVASETKDRITMSAKPEGLRDRT